MVRINAILTVLVTSFSFVCFSVEAREDVKLMGYEVEAAKIINKVFPHQKDEKFRSSKDMKFIYTADPNHLADGGNRDRFYISVSKLIYEATSLISYYTGLNISGTDDGNGNLVFLFSKDFKESMAGPFREIMDVFTSTDVDDYISSFSYDGSGCYTKVVANKLNHYEIVAAVNFIEITLPPDDMRRCIMLSAARSVGFVGSFSYKGINSLASEDDPAVDFTDFDKKVLKYIYQ